MKTKTTARLLVAVCALALVVWFAERRIESTAERRTTSGRLIRSTPADIYRLEVSRQDMQMVCFRTNGVWTLAWPEHARVDEGELARILATMDTAERREIITEQQRRNRELKLADFGLLDPRARVVVHGAAGREEILIGDDTPLGDDIYARLGHETAVMAVSRRLLDAVPEQVEAIRDRALVRGEALLTTRLEIQRAGRGFLQIVRGPQGWTIHQPTVARADGRMVAELLDAIYGLRVGEFVWEPPPAEDAAAVAGTAGPAAAAMEAYGLAADEAVARVNIWLDGGMSRELFLGKQDADDEDAVYARIGSVDSVCSVDSCILDILSVTADDLRDRNLFVLDEGDVNAVRIETGARALALVRSPAGGWSIIEPVQWQAEDDAVGGMVSDLVRTRISGFVDPGRTNLAEFGLDAPALGVLLQREAPAGRSGDEEAQEDGEPVSGAARRHELQPGRLWIGAETKDGDNVFGKFEDESHVYEIPVAMVKRLGADPADPLAYRDRSVLSVDPEHVRRITLVRSGVTQSVEKVEGDAWTAAGTNEVIQTAVNDVLFAIANLRAVAIESLDPDDLAPFGLDRSEVTLTVGLSGEEGIQKSLIFGFRAATRGVFAMVQGLDIVFVLEKRLVERLVTDITRPLPSPATGAG